jgi:hypothetical protein
MAATTLLNLTCVAVPVLTAPTSGYGVFLCIPKEGKKCNIAMHELYIIQTSIYKEIPQYIIKYTPR